MTGMNGAQLIMQLIPEIVAVNKERILWQRDIHVNPELVFVESHTS